MDRAVDVPEITIIGVGNELMGDDGVGVAVARSLKGSVPRGVEVIEACTNCADILMFLKGRKKVIVIDGIDADSEPGSIFRFTIDDVPLKSSESPISLHEFGIPEVVNAAKLLGDLPGDLVFYGVQIKNITVSRVMSSELESAVGEVCRLILEEIGVTPG